MNDREVACPFCSEPQLELGFVWTAGRGLSLLKWAAGIDPPAYRWILGRRADWEIIDSTERPFRAYRCPACNAFVLHPRPIIGEDFDVPRDEDDTSQPSICLACGASIASGSSACKDCGWTYRG